MRNHTRNNANLYIIYDPRGLYDVSKTVCKCGKRRDQVRAR